jgi:hypothetical protein
MAKGTRIRGTPARELLASAVGSAGQGDAAKNIMQQLRAEGFDLALTLRPRKRRRKNRWASAKGKVVAVRFTDADYEILERTAKAKGLSPGGYLKWLATRSNGKGGMR